jgi:rod shape-determining protein MreC
MRNLLMFIWKNNFFFLFIILEVAAFSLIFRHNKFQATGFFNSSNAVVGNIYNSFNNIASYFDLKAQNELLVAENARLLSNAEGSFFKLDSSVVAAPDSFIHDTLKHKFEFREANAVNFSINRRNNFITLNKGSLHGIEPLMGVIAPDGIVGIVKDVSENFSSVISVLNKNTIVSSKLKKSGYKGALMWEGGDPTIAHLYDIPKHAKLTIGDTIISSGASTIFPEGIMVGTIADYKLKDGDNFYQISIKLSTDFGKLGYVYVIKNLMSQEQIELELKSQNDN